MRWMLIDRLIECNPGVRAVAEKTFPRSDEFFADHFPDFPIVPGALQIEMVAQTASRSLRLVRPTQRTVLGSVRYARFRQPIRPGDRCRIVADIAAIRDHYAVEVGSIFVDGVLVSNMEILVAFIDRVTPRALPFDDEIVAEWMRLRGDG